MKPIIKKAVLLPWTNPYVTDGLIAMWDGEWNAGITKHDPDAITWTDLINGYIGVKAKDSVQWLDKACAVENGYFIIDPLPDPIRDAMNADKFTWEVCKLHKSGSGQFTCIENGGVSAPAWQSARRNRRHLLHPHVQPRAFRRRDRRRLRHRQNEI